MICKKCGSVLVEGGIFCANCGARADGKKECIKCKKLIDEKAVYCTFCGSRVDGKTVCKNCGKEMVGTFCAFCGTSSKKSMRSLDKTVGAYNTNSKQTYEKVERFLSPALLLGALLVLFICSFFIGYTHPYYDRYTDLYINKSYTSIYFFKDAYTIANADILASQGDLSANNLRIYSFIAKLPLVFYTIFIAITMLYTCFSLVYGIIKYAKALNNNKRCDISKITTSAFAVFLFTAIFILVNNYISVPENDSTLNIKMSAGSLAGIIIGLILIICSLLLKLIKNGKSLFNKINVIKLIFGSIIIVFSLALVFLLKKYLRITSAYSSVEVMDSSFNLVFNFLAIFLFNYHENINNNTYNSLLVTGTISFFVQMILLIFLAMLIWKAFAELFSCNETSRLVLLSGVFSLVFTIMHFVLSIINKNILQELFVQEGVTSLQLSITSIPILVLGVVLGATCIVYHCLSKKYNKKEENDFYYEI